jgi:hypothetical protein
MYHYGGTIGVDFESLQLGFGDGFDFASAIVKGLIQLTLRHQTLLSRVLAMGADFIFLAIATQDPQLAVMLQE